MNAEEISKAFESRQFVFNGKLPENIKYLYLICGKCIEITEEQREEIIKILEKYDVNRDKLNKLYEDWHKKWFL